MSRDLREDFLGPADLLVLIATCFGFYALQVRPSMMTLVVSQFLFGWSAYILFRAMYAYWSVIKQEPPKSND